MKQKWQESFLNKADDGKNFEALKSAYYEIKKNLEEKVEKSDRNEEK